MPRAVSPWTWRRALRDHGPQNATELLACYTVGTFMDRDGYSFPSQTKIAAGMRCSVRTAQRHIASVQRQGWLDIVLAGRGGQGWRHHAYRACVPDHVMLDELDEKLSDVVISQCGDVSDLQLVQHAPIERDDKAVSPPSAPSEHNQGAKSGERDDNGGRNVTTNDAEADVTGRQKVTTELCRTNSRSETLALRTHTQSEAQAFARAAPFPLGEKREPEGSNSKPQRNGMASLQKVLQGREKGPAPRIKQYGEPLDDQKLKHYVGQLHAAGSSANEIVTTLCQRAHHDRIRRCLANDFGVPWVSSP